MVHTTQILGTCDICPTPRSYSSRVKVSKGRRCRVPFGRKALNFTNEFTLSEQSAVHDMVYFGPSRGCIACRKRKVKCDLNTPACNNCRKRRVQCTGPRVRFSEPDFRPLQLPLTEVVDYDFPTVHTNKKPVPDNSCRQQSPVSELSDLSEEPFFHNTISVPPIPVGGAYGNVTVGVYKANSTLFELIHLWQVKFLNRSSGGTTSALSHRAKALSSFALFDDCKGYCWISSMASYHNMLTESTAMRQVQVESHAQAVVNLREKFDKYHTAMPLLANLNTLINAEFAAGDYATAEHHTRFLAEELDPATCEIKSPIISRLRHTVMILELERSIATLTRPVFDINAWVVHDQAQAILGSRSKTLALRFPSVAPSNLDTEALAAPRLIDVFTRIHHFDQIFRTLELTDTISRDFAFQLSWAAIQLENDALLHCLDLSEIAIASRSPSSCTLDQRAFTHIDRCQYAAAAIASLLYFRIRLRCEQSGSGGSSETALMERFWSVGSLLAKRIITLLQNSDVVAEMINEKYRRERLVSEQRAEPDTELVPRRLRLRIWLLYVGTWIEATSWYRNGKRSSYFSAALTKLCDNVFGGEPLDVRDSAVEKILKGFIVLEHQTETRAPYAVTLKQGPEWLSPALRTWGFANWDGELA